MSLRCLHTSIVFEAPSLEVLTTKAKENPSPHEMKLSPAGHQPSISWSRGNCFYHYYYYLLLLFMIIIIITIILFIVIIINIIIIIIAIIINIMGLYNKV